VLPSYFILCLILKEGVIDSQLIICTELGEHSSVFVRDIFVETLVNCQSSLFTNELTSDCLKKILDKAVPLQAWSGPEGSRKLSFLDFMTTAQDGGKIVSPTHRQPLPPGKTLGTHFC